MSRQSNRIGAKQRAYQKGRRAEGLARWLLRLKGYRILESQRRGGRGTNAGEIDIIALRGGTLVFVEVKARASFEAGIQAISPQQQARIRRASEAYFARYAEARAPSRGGLNGRFDAILVAPGPLGLPKIRHLQNAWS
jgi:putative endonuclease